MKHPINQQSQRWFFHAKDEFKDADDIRRLEKHYLALFHFQQATEKALKAFLYTQIKSQQIFFTHSVDELIEMAITFDKDFEKVRSSKKLDQYYIPTRYPNGLPGGVPSRYYTDPDETKQAMLLAKQVINLIEKKLESIFANEG